MEVFRIEKEKYLQTIFDGFPGKEFDFRWNTKGHPIIYASESRSLALHEKCANMGKPFYGLSTSFKIAMISLPDMLFRRILANELPKDWNNFNTYHPVTQKIGDDFCKSEELALLVPSTIVNGEFNVIINPRIIEQCKVKLSVEKIDRRLLNL